MTREALLLTLSAAVLHATWNFAAKRAEGGGPVFVWGYAAGDLNLVYPLARGTGPLLTVLVAVLVLRQPTTVVAMVGVGLVVAGVLVIALGRRGGADPRRRRLGAAYGLATGASIAAYTLWDAHAVTSLGLPALPYFTLGLLGQTAGLTPAAWRRRATVATLLHRHRAEILVVAVLSPLAYVFVLQALTLSPVSVVAPVRETSIVIGALLSWLVLREPQPAG